MPDPSPVPPYLPAVLALGDRAARTGDRRDLPCAARGQAAVNARMRHLARVRSDDRPRARADLLVRRLLDRLRDRDGLRRCCRSVSVLDSLQSVLDRVDVLALHLAQFPIGTTARRLFRADSHGVLPAARLRRDEPHISAPLQVARFLDVLTAKFANVHRSTPEREGSTPINCIS